MSHDQKTEERIQRSIETGFRLMPRFQAAPQNQKVSFLDKNLRRCAQDEAVLCDTTNPVPRENLLPGWEQSLKGFDPEIGEAIKKNCRNLPPDPVGPGEAGEKLRLGGYRFEWQPSGVWRARRQQCDIEIRPEASRSDTVQLLGKLKKVEARILNRGRATWERPLIRIGTGQKTHERVAGAYSALGEGMHVFFYAAHDGCRFMATRAQEACGIKMEKTILHEVGHLLEPLLKERIETLEEGVFDHFAEIEPLLREISPRYLGGRSFLALQEETLQVKEAATKRLETILVGGKPRNRESYTRQRRKHITSEIVAEVLRHFYLEPCLTGRERKPIQTPWKNLNGLMGLLVK